MITAKYYELFTQNEGDVNFLPHAPILQEVVEYDTGEMNDVYYVRGDGEVPSVEELGLCTKFQRFINALSFARNAYILQQARWREAEIQYQRYLRHEYQDTYVCKHQYLELTDEGNYECSVCGMTFNMEIPY